MDLLEMYDRASDWAVSRAEVAAAEPRNTTPCEDWDVATLMDHMVETQRYFIGAALGEDMAPPASDHPREHSEDPVADLREGRQRILQTFAGDGVIERTGPTLGIAFSDQLLHGWDLAVATDQDATMPAELAEAAYETVHGAFTDDQREGVFGPEVEVPAGASAQERLLGYTGRHPGGTIT